MSHSDARGSRLDTIAYVVTGLVLFLAPIFFVPMLSVPFQLGKTALILWGIAIAFALWMVARLKDGEFEFPKSWLYASSGLVVVTYLVSALVSGNTTASLSGQAFELGTASFFIASFALFALIPLLARTKERIFGTYLAFLGAFLVIALFHLSRFMFGADFLSFGLLGDATSNTLGKWNDLGIFFGLAAIISLITLERATLGSAMKALVWVSLVLSLALSVVVNFTPVWITLSFLTLVLFVYDLSFGKKGGDRRVMPVKTLVVLVLSVFFAFAGQGIGGMISNSLGISQVEVRPSWGATADISASTLSSDPVFGIGPNRFSAEWLEAKPDGINNTLFWNVDFNYGIGFIPSFVATTGIVGTVAILAFVLLFAWTALRALVRESSNPFSRYLVLSSLFGSVFLWVFAIVYVPSSALWVITLGMTGLFIAALREDGAIGTKTVAVANRPALSFISVLLTILALIGTLSFVYHVSVKTMANVAFQKGVITISNGGSLDEGEAHILRAINLSESDVYYRFMSEVYLARLNQLFANETIGETEAQAQFQSLLGTAIQASQRAVAIDPTNYQNHLSLGRVFEAVVPLNIEGAYENAKTAYEAALARNPHSPEIELILARLEIANDDNDAAREHIEKSLAEKSDYAEAIFLLSQIDIAEGNIADAIRSVEAVATLSPNDSGVFFQLGLLYYNQRNYENARLALERAVALNPQYANAKYFLGLSYWQTDEDSARAIAQFEDLAKSNPDNAEVKAILENLKAGKSPFTDQPDSRPERRSTLPVDEN